jgi:hypothetical protein
VSSAAYQKEWARRLRKAVIAFLGGKCVRCGFDDPRALQVDHVNGGGSAERKKYKNAKTVIYRRVLNGKPGYQLLCANCNWIKRDEEGSHSGHPCHVDHRLEP